MNFLRISHRAPLLLVKTGKSSLHSKSRSNLLWIGAIACFAPVQVYCVEEGKDKDEDKDPLKKFKEVWGITPDLLNKEITFGAIAGVCSGVVLKKLGSFLAILGGTMFLSLQFASHYGYIEVDWRKIEHETIGLLDYNKDGQLDYEDFRCFINKVKEIGEKNISTASGYGVGLAIGLRFG